MKADATATSRLALLLACSALACQPAGPNAFSEEHAAAVADSARRALSEYVDHVNAGRWDSAVSYYANDSRFQWLEDGRLAYSSPEEIRTAIRSMEAMFQSSELTLSDTRVIPLAPGVAAVSTSFQQALTDTAGSAFSFGGAISLIAVHTESGWKMLIGHTSTERTR